MRKVKKSFEIEYNEFEVGEMVKPTSNRCPLEPGVYKVTKFIPPMTHEDSAVVFVEGHEYGIETTYLRSVEN